MLELKNDRMTFVAVGAVFAFIGVALGAFGAHALSERLDARALEIWKTAVFYHLLHAVALIATAPIAPRITSVAFVAGMLLFSGSLYALALSGVRWLGAITPLGGLAFLTGWLVLAVSALRETRAN